MCSACVAGTTRCCLKGDRLLLSAFRHTTREALDWLLPSECLLCEAATDANPDRVPLTVCVDCFEDLKPPLAAVCVACGAQLGPHTTSSSRCPHCRGRRFQFKSVTCLGMYNGTLRRLLLEGKWSLSSNIIRTLATVYLEARAAELRSLNIERIIPIPQIWHLRARRNFNAAALLAAEIGKLLIPLRRVKCLRNRRDCNVARALSSKLCTIVWTL